MAIGEIGVRASYPTPATSHLARHGTSSRQPTTPTPNQVLTVCLSCYTAHDIGGKYTAEAIWPQSNALARRLSHVQKSQTTLPWSVSLFPSPAQNCRQLTKGQQRINRLAIAATKTAGFATMVSNFDGKTTPASEESSTAARLGLIAPACRPRNPRSG
jgi:hypothetical protein